jgi:hypothetical protein
MITTIETVSNLTGLIKRFYTMSAVVAALFSHSLLCLVHKLVNAAHRWGLTQCGAGGSGLCTVLTLSGQHMDELLELGKERGGGGGVSSPSLSSQPFFPAHSSSYPARELYIGLLTNPQAFNLKKIILRIVRKTQCGAGGSGLCTVLTHSGQHMDELLEMGKELGGGGVSSPSLSSQPFFPAHSSSYPARELYIGLLANPQAFNLKKFSEELFARQNVVQEGAGCVQC